MEQVFIVNGARSPIGIENGIYRNIPAEVLGAKIIKKVASTIPANDIDLVIAGNGVGGGGNIARLACLTAGLPESVPAFSVDLQCGSGLESIAIAAAKIQSGQADVVLAGGFESSSTAPRRAYNRNHPDYDTYGGEQSWYSVAKFTPGEHRPQTMLEGAERTAIHAGITRQQLDRWVLRSHELAQKARVCGVLTDLLEEVVDGVTADEGIRPRMSQKLLNRLPFILPDGQVLTAANSCLTNDGAAFVLLCSKRYMDAHKLTPFAEFIDVAEIGATSNMSPRTAILAISKLLDKHQMSADDISIFECNEAFAVIDELFAREFGESAVARYNIYGGALAYGHPYGASGGIITLHAMRALQNTNGTYAVCSIAAAGGVGSAILLKGVNNHA